jgi:hypothetical protein
MTTQSLILYKAISPQQLVELKLSKHNALTVDFAEQKSIYLKLNKAYAEMIARQWHLPLYGAAFIIAVELPSRYLKQFAIESFGLAEHSQYCIPIVELGNLNNQLSAKIDVISGIVHRQIGNAKPVAPLLNMTELRLTA